jgi:tetratricopeptide (TPR) repeat protein
MLPCADVVAEDASTAALMKQAAALRSDYEYRAAEKILRGVLAREPDHLGAQLTLANVLSAVGEGAEALRLVRAVVERHPKRVEPYRALGMLVMDAEGPEAGKASFEKALALEPKDVRSMCGLAVASLAVGDLEDADRWLTQAEAHAADAIQVLLTRARWLFRSKRTDEAARMYASVLAREPWNLPANATAANGIVIKGSPLYRPPWTPMPYDRRIKRAAQAYRSRSFGEAETRFAKLDDDKAYDGRPAFYRGLVALRLGKTRAAIDLFKRAVSREPDNFLFRNGYVRAVSAHVSNQRAEYGAGADDADRLGPIADISFQQEELPGVERFVRGYEALLPREQQVVLRAVRPFRKYLPALLRQGATHDIVGMEVRITEAAERAKWREAVAHDGRAYPAVRGMGGMHAATGLEFILDASRMREDVFAHEFAHQVHRFAFDADQKYEIHRLYLAALEHGRALRPYARTNEFEYFAVAYEAFVSPVKSPWQRVSEDRAELKARDPKLYAFLLDVTETPEPDPMLERLREPVLAFYEWAGHEQRLRRARDLYGDKPATR